MRGKILVALFLVSGGIPAMGCAPTTSRGPNAIHSSEIAAALARPREHPDAPLVVRDEHGRLYTLGLDEPVVAEAPPDGVVRTTTARSLALGCEAGASEEAGRACWLRRSFDVKPVATPSATTNESSSNETVLGILAGAVIVGAIAGSGYCWYECKEPWDSAVPIAAGTLTLGVLVVGVALAASSMSATR